MVTNSKKQLPQTCPSCGNQLAVERLVCNSCETHIQGNYGFPFLARLSEEEQQFILGFVKNSGSLKAMAKQMNRSYPSVRNYLNDLITKIQNLERYE